MLNDFCSRFSKQISLQAHQQEEGAEKPQVWFRRSEEESKEKHQGVHGHALAEAENKVCKVKGWLQCPFFLHIQGASETACNSVVGGTSSACF